MTPITEQEQRVIRKVITEVGDMTSKMEESHGTDDRAVIALGHTYAYLLGLVDSGYWGGSPFSVRHLVARLQEQPEPPVDG